MKITFKTPDFRKAIVELEKVEGKKLQQVQDEIQDSADRIVGVAKNLSPINESRLRNSISAKQITPFIYEVVAQTKYAAFMEFGTKTLVNIPPGAEEIANEARKIKGGTIEEMERSIRRWVRLKGLGAKGRGKDKKDDSIVFLIMRKILRVGVKPQPFFFPSIQKETSNLKRNLEKLFK